MLKVGVHRFTRVPQLLVYNHKKGAYRRKAICTFFELLIKLLIIRVNILFTLREYVTLDFWVKSIYTYQASVCEKNAVLPRQLKGTDAI